MKNILLTSLAAILLFACKEKVINQDSNNLEDTATENIDSLDFDASDTLVYQIKSFDKRSKDCVSDSVNCAIFKASFPLINSRQHARVADLINTFIRSEVYQPLIGEEQPNGLNGLLAPYFQAFSESLQTHQNEGEDTIIAWKFTRIISVIDNLPKLFTISRYERSYAGGAHPNSFTNFYHFNPKNGEKLSLEDFFIKGFKKELTPIAEKSFRKTLNVSPKANLVDEGFWFKNKVFELNDNFWFTEQGIHFLYNPYEVAAYAVGPIEAKVSYSDIEGLLKEEYKHLSTNRIQ